MVVVTFSGTYDKGVCTPRGLRYFESRLLTGNRPLDPRSSLRRTPMAAHPIKSCLYDTRARLLHGESKYRRTKHHQSMAPCKTVCVI